MKQTTHEWFLKQEEHKPLWLTYHNVFNEDEIHKIIEIGDNLQTEPARVGDGIIPYLKENVRKTTLAFIPVTDDNEWLFRKLTDVINDVNEKYFQYEIERIQALQYSIYNVDDFFGTHIDTQPFNRSGMRKISFSLQLTEENNYTGGNLVFKHQKEPEIAVREKGVITFFNSILAHEVTPVTSGTRKALVGWVLGPAFK